MVMKMPSPSNHEHQVYPKPTLVAPLAKQGRQEKKMEKKKKKIYIYIYRRLGERE
jgi:hypothetical protein